ncbi:MAG: glycosyltransferase family 1 protein, partial [Geobacter sp.]
MEKCGKGIHVLMVAIKFPPHFGGAAIQASYLAAELVRRGAAVQFITDNDDRPTMQDVYNGLPVYRFSTFLKMQTKAKEAVYVFRVFWFIVTHPEYRIIHFHSIRGTESLMFPLLRLMGRKILVKLTLVDNDDPMTLRRRKLGRFFRWGLSFVNHFTAISRRLCELASEAKIPAQRVSLITNGVETNRFLRPSAEERYTLRDRLELPQDAILFLCVGKIEPRKGYDFLLQAWQHIQSLVYRPVLVIAGPGNTPENPFYQKLTTTIRELQLKRVRFTGQVETVETYMRSADCFLFCSRQEGFGTVLIEAMASGVPVVARHILHVTEDILIEPTLSKTYWGD